MPSGDLIRKIAGVGNFGRHPQNNERDLQRLIKRHGVSLDVKIEYCEVETYNPKTEQRHITRLPIIFPDTFAASVFEKSESLFKSIFFADVDALAYWNHVERHCGWFQDHPCKDLGPERRAKLIPFSMYGDEVQSFRNTEGGIVSVMAWSSDFGHGRPPLSRYFCICCVCDHYCTENTHKEILTHVAKRVTKMCDPNEEHVWTSRGYSFAYSSTQGDLKYVYEKYGLHNFRQNSMCSRCCVKKSDPDLSMTVGDFRLTSGHLQTHLDHDAFFRQQGVSPSDFNPIFSIPGSRLERVLHDVMHSQLLGTGKTLNGSVLTYLAEAGMFGPFSNGLYLGTNSEDSIFRFHHLEEGAADQCDAATVHCQPTVATDTECLPKLKFQSCCFKSSFVLATRQGNFMGTERWSDRFGQRGGAMCVFLL